MDARFSRVPGKGIWALHGSDVENRRPALSDI